MSELDIERIATALTKLAAAFDQYNILYRKRLDLEHPPPKAKRAPEVITTRSERQEQFSDNATDEWLRETQAAIPEPSRFQKRYDRSPDKQTVETPRRRRVVEVPKEH